MRYIHYSSRREPPSVPPRAINQFSAGTGPLGVYAYQEDARTVTFAATRPYVFTIVPTVDVVFTKSYSMADLDRDLERLRATIDIARPLQLWGKLVAKSEARNEELPFAILWYVVTHLTRSTDPEDLPSRTQSTCSDPVLARDLLLYLGHKVIDDRLGVMYSSEPEQALFLTDDSFDVVDLKVMETSMLRRNPDSRDTVIIDIIHDAARQVATGPGRRQAWIRDVWDQIMRNGKADDLVYEDFKHDIERLHRAQLISLAPMPKMVKGMRSVEADDSELDIDGRLFYLINIPTSHQMSAPPRTAATGDASDFATTVLEIARQVGPGFGDRKVFIGDIWKAAQKIQSMRALGEPEFKRRLVAAHRASQLVMARADLVGAMDPNKVAASETVTDGATFHFVVIEPVRNPGRRRNPKRLPLVRNPPEWVTKMIAASYETLEDTVPPQWLPRLTNIERSGDGIAGDTKEYGCGTYGCVFPTLDPAVVLKVTHDDTEAEFAARLSPTLVAQICVKYHMVLKLDAERDGHGVYLLWRDGASFVGDLDGYLDDLTDDPTIGDEFMRLVNGQHNAAKMAMIALHTKAPRDVYKPLLNRWVTTLKKMATQDDVPQLRELAAGMLEVYLEQRVAILDVHDGNLGLVRGDDGEERFLITDPGHVVVIDE